MNDGFDIPQVGLASFRSDSKEDVRKFIVTEMECGVRHLEFTELLGNGHVVVESVRSGKDIPRSDCFFTFKVWPKNRKPKGIIAACKETLRYVGLEYVDLVLLHAPIDIKNLNEQWRGLEALKNEGIARSIGVANMSLSQLSELLKNSLIAPAVVEV